MTITQTQQAGLYRRAAQAIRDRGLAKRTYEEADGSLCTVGALNAVTGDYYHLNLLPHLADVLGYTPSSCRCGHPDCGMGGDPAFNAVTEWNDLPTTTEQDVITLLETAAEKLEANQP